MIQARACPTCGHQLTYDGPVIPDHGRDASILYLGRRKKCPASGCTWPTRREDVERMGQ